MRRERDGRVAARHARVTREAQPAPGVSFCGPEEQGPPIWNGKPVEDRPTPANPAPAAEIVKGARTDGERFIRLGDSSLRFFSAKRLSQACGIIHVS